MLMKFTSYNKNMASINFTYLLFNFVKTLSGFIKEFIFYVFSQTIIYLLYNISEKRKAYTKRDN
ncbi:MAG: hypothetical protein K0R36_873 [Chryseobacterium sp.]|jgi:hypothetical protein|nr:hypothetical protein [Chryseobacterium sp.]